MPHKDKNKKNFETPSGLIESPSFFEKFGIIKELADKVRKKIEKAQPKRSTNKNTEKLLEKKAKLRR